MTAQQPSPPDPRSNDDATTAVSGEHRPARAPDHRSRQILTWAVLVLLAVAIVMSVATVARSGSAGDRPHRDQPSPACATTSDADCSAVDEPQDRDVETMQ